MKLQFVLGRSGSGKTCGIYRKMIERAEKEIGTDFLFVVPEQATLLVQQELIREHPRHGLLNLDVLSFQRLAYRVFEEQNFTLPVVLDDIGKSMLLRKVLYEVAKDLTVFGGNVRRKGFVEQMKSMISELAQYRVTWQQLMQMTDGLEDEMFLAGKLKDIALVQKAFEAQMGELFITSENLLMELAKLAGRSKLLAGSVLILDGFTGFTPVQYRLLEELLAVCREVWVVLTLSPESGNGNFQEHELFAMSKRTVLDLREKAQRLGVPVAEPLWIVPETLPRWQNEELRFLESQYEQKRGRWEKETEHLFLHAARNPSQEIEWLCTNLLYLVREKGYRYQEIAVMTGDIHTYGPLLEMKLFQAGVPCFCDRKQSLRENSAVDTVLAVLEIIEKNYSFESVFRYLKAGIAVEQTETLYRMENYCLAAGIRGRKGYEKIWEWMPAGYTPEMMQELNEAKEQYLRPVFDLDERIRKKVSVSERLKGLTGWMAQVGLEGAVENRRVRLEEAGELTLSQEYAQVTVAVRRLFEQVDGLIGDQTVSLQEFREVLETGFEELSVGVVPPTLDRLVIADLKRSRLAGIRVLFIVGMNDGIFPPLPAGGGVINDSERERLAQFSLTLAPTVKQESFTDKFYLYLAFTRPSERLYLSYSQLSEEGKSLRASYVCGQIRKLFPLIRDSAGKLPLYHARQGLELLARGEEEAQRYIGYFRSRPEYAGLLRLIRQGKSVSCKEESISREAAEALFAQPAITSVTHLERFASCEFAHFLQYGLRLLPRQVYELQRTDLGNLYHEALDFMFREIQKRGWDFRSLSGEQKQQLLKEGEEKAVGNLGRDILGSSSRYSYVREKLRSVLELNFNAILAQLEKGAFTPAASEMAFGMAGDGKKQYPPIHLPGSPLALRGKVDRFDLAYTQENTPCIKIVDYKTGDVQLDLTKVYYGLQLQLLLYLEAVRTQYGADAQEAGAFYYHISEPMPELPVPEGKTPEEIRQLVQEKQMELLRMNGIASGDAETLRLLEKDLFEKGSSAVLRGLKIKKDGTLAASSPTVTKKQMEKLRALAKEKAAFLAGKLLSGSAERNPYLYKGREACRYCAFRGICGFDTGIRGFAYRRLTGVDPEKIYGKTEE